MRELFLVFLIFFISACSLTQKEKKLSLKKIDTRHESAIRSYASYEDIIRLKSKLNSDSIVLRIFGDSHIASDFFSKELRTNLIKANSIGYIYALQPRYQQTTSVSYWSKDFELENSKSNTGYSYGMGGILAKAKKEGALIKISSNLKEQNFDIKIFYKAKNKGFILSDANKQRHEIRQKSTKKFIGKKIKNVKFPIEIKALEKDLQISGLLIYKEDKKVRILDTVAMNGARSDIWLRWDKGNMQELFKDLKNDIIILAYGSNDAFTNHFDKNNFKNNYKKFINFLRKNNENVNILLISPPTITQKEEDKYVLNPNFKLLRDSIYEIAKEERLMLFDMHSFIQDSGGKEFWIEQKLSFKDVHLSISGYKIMADKFMQDLRSFLATF